MRNIPKKVSTKKFSISKLACRLPEHILTVFEFATFSAESQASRMEKCCWTGERFKVGCWRPCHYYLNTVKLTCQYDLKTVSTPECWKYDLGLSFLPEYFLYDVTLSTRTEYLTRTIWTLPVRPEASTASTTWILSVMSLTSRCASWSLSSYL